MVWQRHTVHVYLKRFLQVYSCDSEPVAYSQEFRMGPGVATSEKKNFRIEEDNGSGPGSSSPPPPATPTVDTVRY